MENNIKKRVVLFGIAAAIVICAALISVQAMPGFGKEPGNFGFLNNAQWHRDYDANMHKAKDMDRIQIGRPILGSLGLPADANKEQIMEAIKQKQEEAKPQKLQAIKTALGLPDGATNEEVQIALGEWREKNKVLIEAVLPARHNLFGKMRGKKMG